MDRALLIAVRFHDGRYHGAGDWPPAPARLFQALVAGAARGARLDDADATALAWLEALAPPEIAAPPSSDGQAVLYWVPNNDLDARGGDPDRVGEIRAGKLARPRLFDAARPILYRWRYAGDPSEAAQVCAIALRLHQLGRGVDMAWATAETPDAGEADAAMEAHGGAVLRPGGAGDVAVPAPGTLASLIRRHEAARTRFSTAGKGRAAKRVFTAPPRPFLARVGYGGALARLTFDIRDDAGFAARRLEGAATLTAALRDAAVSRLARALPADGETVRRLVGGQGAGPADLAKRVRLLPLPSVGHEHADPSVRRLLVLVPPDCPLRREDVAWAFDGLAPFDPDTGEITADWRLVPAEDLGMTSRYLRPARRWRTLTPAALPSAARRRIDPAADGAPKAGAERQAEEGRARAAVLAALRHAGVAARPGEIVVQREPFDARGAMAGECETPERISKHALWHVALRFSDPVPGPLVIGDGRFCGLGVMAPIEEAGAEGVLAFDLHAARVSPQRAAEALRRTLMGRVAELTGDRALPPILTGHHPDGAPLRPGGRAHVACVGDGRRVLLIAPHRLDHRPMTSAEDEGWGLARRALRDIDWLGGGLRIARAPINEDDPLLAPARVWESVTPWAPTRHSKGDVAAHIASDIAEDCRRRALPPPTVEILSLDQGPRGGLTARLRLSFCRLAPGPVALGRQAQKGGGLFRGVAG